MAVNASLLETSQQEASTLRSLSTEDFLLTVGKRVRQHRGVLRMSRKRLAELSGVSERYLAQLESGQGNMSIILLRRVSVAIDLPLDVLMSERTCARTEAVNEQPREQPTRSVFVPEQREPLAASARDSLRDARHDARQEPDREPRRQTEFG